jgi:hypothetical protein
MSILAVVQDVCAVVGVERPTAIFPNIAGNRTMTEMLALANETAQRIAYDTRDWTILFKQAMLTGDGVAEAFNLPADFKRMLLTTNVWRSTSTMAPMRFVPDMEQWFQHRAWGYADPRGEWTMYGGKIHIVPIMQKHTSQSWKNARPYQTPGELAVDAADQTVWQVAVAHVSAAVGTTFAADRTNNPSYWTFPVQTIDAVTARFPYLEKNCIALASGGVGDAFLQDGDSFRLDERMFKLGMIWAWKQLKGSPYAEDMANYQDSLTRVAGADQPAPIIIGRMPISSAVNASYPFPINPGMVPL